MEASDGSVTLARGDQGAGAKGVDANMGQFYTQGRTFVEEMHVPSSPSSRDCPSIGVGRTPAPPFVLSCIEKCRCEPEEFPVSSIVPNTVPCGTNIPTLTGTSFGPERCRYRAEKCELGIGRPKQASMIARVNSL